MSDLTYPRVLIIGQTFSGISGASITLRNLFKGWPKEKLATASMSIDEYDSSLFEYCVINYKLGSNEVKVLPIVSRFFLVGNSKIVAKSTINNKLNESKGDPGLRGYTKLLVKKLLIRSGINSVRFKYSPNEDFLNWYNEFNPQIVYSALGDLDLIRFLISIKQIDQVPLALHIWDDWPNTLSERSIFKRFWGNKIDKAFREIISKAELLLSISEEMTKAYKKLYGRHFSPFHNPIDSTDWDKVMKKNKEVNIKQVLYVGKINDDTIDLLVMMAKLSENPRHTFNIKFEIYTPNRFKYSNEFKRFSKTTLNEALPHDKIISKIQSADILFLPLGFSNRSINYTRLSMPTKASEYMVSKVPVIIMAPPNIALTKYAKEYNWAEVVDKCDIDMLADSIEKLCFNESHRLNMVTKAYALGIEKHEAVNVRNNFRELMIQNSRYD